MLIVPPGSGIVHQVNLEYLARVCFTEGDIVYPDSVVGTGKDIWFDYIFWLLQFWSTLFSKIDPEFFLWTIFKKQLFFPRKAYEKILQSQTCIISFTDSHTTMINGLGVLGWGVGGIEAEAVMLGQPISMVLPKVMYFLRIQQF